VVEVHTPVPTRDLAALTRWAVEHDVEFEGLSLQRASFEETYLDLVGARSETHDG
jgi:hypothetical protein